MQSHSNTDPLNKNTSKQPITEKQPKYLLHLHSEITIAAEVTLETCSRIIQTHGSNFYLCKCLKIKLLDTKRPELALET
jgi:hypothetical protein